MGIEEEADRTLFIRNLDARVTEELLFELFLQVGVFSPNVNYSQCDKCQMFG